MQVRAVLGEPDQRGEESWLWSLGPQPEAGGLDEDVLTVRFGEDGRVAEVEVATT
jgi:hypothetical protein